MCGRVWDRTPSPSFADRGPDHWPFTLSLLFCEFFKRITTIECVYLSSIIIINHLFPECYYGFDSFGNSGF